MLTPPDVFYTNSRYAKVGGLPPHELNQLELQFLLLNDFRLVIPTDEMQRYGNRLLGYWENKEADDRERAAAAASSTQSGNKGEGSQKSGQSGIGAPTEDQMKAASEMIKSDSGTGSGSTPVEVKSKPDPTATSSSSSSVDHLQNQHQHQRDTHTSSTVEGDRSGSRENEIERQPTRTVVDKVDDRGVNGTHEIEAQTQAQHPQSQTQAPIQVHGHHDTSNGQPSTINPIPTA